MSVLNRLFGRAKSEQKQSRAPLVLTGRRRGGKQEICVEIDRLKAILLYATDFESLVRLSVPSGQPEEFLLYILEKYDPLIYKEVTSRIKANATNVPHVLHFDAGSKLSDPYTLVQNYCEEFGISEFHLLAQCTSITIKGGKTFSLCLAFLVAASEGEKMEFILQDHSGLQDSVVVPV